MAVRKPEAAAPNPEPTNGEMVPLFYSQDNGAGYPMIDVAPPFLFAHHRRRFYIVDGRIVPELAPIPLVSGINEVVVDEGGRIHFANAQARLAERHWRIITPDKAPNGRTYLRTVETVTRDGAIAKTTITVFETAHAGESKTSWDFKAYADWLESLVSRGIVDGITPHRASEMLATARSSLAKAEQRLASGRTGSPERVEALRAEVAILEKAAKARGAPVASTEAELDIR